MVFLWSVVIDVYSNGVKMFLNEENFENFYCGNSVEYIVFS